MTFNIVSADIERIPLTGVVICLPILTRKLLAGANTGARRTTRSGPSTGRASPITTEGGVNDGKVVLEELPWIAGGRRVVGNGLRPGVGERGTVRDILGYVVAREKVDGDARVIPLHRIDPAAGIVEGSTVAVIVEIILHAATPVCSLCRSAVRTSVEGTDRVQDVRRWRYGTTGRSVDRNLVYIAVVNTFDNVNFTLIRPVGAVGPEGRPGATPDGHVDRVEDEETTVEDVVVVETDRLAIARDSRGSFDTQDGIAGTVDLDELVVPSTILVLVVDHAVGGIGEGPEVPAVEEGTAFLEEWRGLNSAWSRLGCPNRHKGTHICKIEFPGRGSNRGSWLRRTS